MTAPADVARDVFRRTMAGIALVTLGLLLWALYRFAANDEAHSYTGGRPPPATVDLTSGHTYWLAIPGGVRSLPTNVPSDQISCRANVGSGSSTLTIRTEDRSNTKATDAIASFVSPVDGPAHVTCSGLTAVYVDNATGDPSGWLLVGGTALLVVGVPLLLSAARSSWLARPPGPTRPPATVPPPIDVL